MWKVLEMRGWRTMGAFTVRGLPGGKWLKRGGSWQLLGPRADSGRPVTGLEQELKK